MDTQSFLNVHGQTAVITGGNGEIGKGIASGLAHASGRVAIVGLRAETASRAAQAISAEGGEAIGIAADVNDRVALERVLEQVHSAFGPVDILLNAAGGNKQAATTSAERSFFELDAQAIENVFNLACASSSKNEPSADVDAQRSEEHTSE